MNLCEFCGRFAYMNDGETCNGCGAPLARKESALNNRPMLYMYDSRIIDAQAFAVGPGQNIPVNIPEHSKISDFLQTAAMVGASMLSVR